MRTVLIIIFGLITIVSQAQETSKSKHSKSRIFADIDIGVLLVPDYSFIINTHFSVGAGYRINEHHGLGIEYRTARLSNTYYSDSGKGVGLCYRLTYKGIFLKLSAGKQFSGKKGALESILKHDYDSGGSYQNMMLGYHFRNGIFLGFSLTNFRNTQFQTAAFEFYDDYTGERDFFNDVRELPPEAGTFLPSEVRENEFLTGTITFGYAFPGRGRK